MNKIIQQIELYNAYIHCRRRKRKTINSIKFEINELYNLYVLYNDLVKYEYVIGKSIAFICYYPKPREIFAADFRDRIVHHLIYDRDISYFENFAWITDTYSCRVNKGTLYGVNHIKQQIINYSNNYEYLVFAAKCDLKSFFVYIDKDILYKILEKFIRSVDNNRKEEDIEFDLYLWKLIIYNRPQDNCIFKQSLSCWNSLEPGKSLREILPNDNRGFAIGNLTSQMLANFYMSVFDYYVYYDLNLPYGRYVDDFVILNSDQENANEIVNNCTNYLKDKLKLTLHPNKTQIQEISHGVQMTGAIIKKDRIYINNRTVHKFESVLIKWYYFIIKCNENNQEITYENIKHYVDSVNSYLGMMIHYSTFNIRKRLLTSKYIQPYLDYIDIDNSYKQKNDLKLELGNVNRNNDYYIDEQKTIKKVDRNFKYKCNYKNEKLFKNPNLFRKVKIKEDFKKLHKQHISSTSIDSLMKQHQREKRKNYFFRKNMAKVKNILELENNRNFDNLYTIRFVKSNNGWFNVYEWSAYLVHLYRTMINVDEHINFYKKLLKGNEYVVFGYVVTSLHDKFNMIPENEIPTLKEFDDVKYFEIDLREYLNILYPFNDENYKSKYEIWRNSINFKDKINKNKNDDDSKKISDYNYNNIKYLLDKINEYDIDSGEMKNYAFISSIKEIIRNINI